MKNYVKGYLSIAASFVLTVIGVTILVSEKEVSASHYGILLLASIVLFAYVVKDVLETVFAAEKTRRASQEAAAAIRNKEIYAPQQVFAPAVKPVLPVVPPPKKREDTVSYVRREDTIAYSTVPVESFTVMTVDISASEPSNDYSSSSDSGSSPDFSGGGGDFGGGGSSGSWD
jgi:uncharacterized membrane protein YgcG